MANLRIDVKLRGIQGPKGVGTQGDPGPEGPIGPKGEGVFPAGAWQANGPWGPAAYTFIDGSGKQGFGLDKHGNLVVSDLVVAGSISGSQIDKFLRRARNRAGLNSNALMGRLAIPVEPHMPWAVGDRLRLSSRGRPDQWMEGEVIHYQGGWLLLWIDDVSNVVGTFNDWVITPGTLQRSCISDSGPPDARRGSEGQSYYQKDTGATWARVGGAWRRMTAGPYVDSATIVVSNVAMNGIPIGDDATGTGTMAKPFLTIEKALTVVPVNGVIMLNGSPSGAATYQSTAPLAITKAVTIESILPFGARIISLSSANVISLAIPAGEICSIGQVIVDCRNATNVGISLPDGAGLYGLFLSGTKLIDWKVAAVARAGNATNCYLVLTNTELRALQAPRAIDMTSMASGVVDIKSSTLSINRQDTASAGIVEIKAVAAGVQVDIGRSTITNRLLSSLTGSGTHYGISVMNVPGAKIWGSRVEVSGEYGDRNGCPIRITADLAAPLDSSGFEVMGNYTLSACMGGYNIKIGEESGLTPVSGMMNNGNIHHNYAYGGDKAAAGALHAIFIASRSNAKVHHNWMQNVGIGLVDKSSLNAQWWSNVVVDAYSAGMVMKGSKGTWMDHNTIVQLTARGNMVQISDNDATGEDSTEVAYRGNLFVSKAQNTGGARITQNQTFEAKYNCYVLLEGGSWINNGFKWNAAGLVARNQPATSGIPEAYYNTVAAWNADHEQTSVSGDPNFTDMANLDFSLGRASMCDALVPPGPASIDTDYNGRPYDPALASVGAFSLYW